MQNLARSISRHGVCTMLAVVIALSLPLVAQEPTGRVIGIVTDPSGSVVPHAKVTVTNAATNIKNETTTGEDGSFQVLLLPPGMYHVTAEAQGFRRLVTSDQRLDVDRSLRIDIKLEVGATTETIQVEANATGVETVNSELSQVVTGNQIHNAPLNGRNVMDLALLMPGVIPAVNGPLNTAGGSGFSIAGARTDSITYLLDGGVNSNLLNNGLVLNPNPDAIDEFRVLTSNYNAEYGRNAGGIVSVVTRRGTNDFHGALYDYVRNAVFNANSFFNNEQGLPKDNLKRNQFGAVIAGPVLFPKLFNGRNKVFFMMAYQGQRLSQTQTASKVNVFTPAELGGDFSHSNSSHSGPDPLVVNFLQKYPFFQSNPALAAQGIIDPAKINPVATNYIKAGLLPTAPSGFSFAQGALRDDRDELTERLDFEVTDRDRVSVTLGSSRNPQTSPFAFANVSGYPNVTYANRYLGNANYTKTFSPTLINEFRFTAQRNNVLQAVPGVKAPLPNQLGIGVTPDDPTGPPILGFTSMVAGFSPQGPTALIDNTYTWSDTLTWIKGRNSFKTGFSYSPYQDNTAYDFYVNGEFYFYGTGGGSFSQNDRADFLMGLPDEYLQFPRAPSNIRTHNIAGFFQDEWKVRPNLTLTLGIRYEYSSPKVDTQGRSFSAILGKQSQVFPKAPLGLVFPGDPGVPVGSNFPDKNDWAPRIGFAWAPGRSDKMSIRGGFGVFYDILKGEDNLQFNGQAPFFGTADLFFNALSQNPSSPSIYMSQPFVAAGVPNSFPSKPPDHNIDFNAAGFLPFGAGGVYFVNPHLRTPYIFQYNLSVQREIARGTTLEASFIGSSSHKLTGLYEADPFVLGTTRRLFNSQAGVANNTFSYLDTFDNVGNGHYTSLAVGLTKRLSDVRYVGNVSYQFSWTYGHSIDNISGFRSRDSRVPYYNWGQFKGTSDFDLTHYVAVSASWELPFAKAWQNGPTRLTKGWTMYPILTYRSGIPLDVLAGLSRSISRPGTTGAGDANLVRANLVGQINFQNPDSFQTFNGRSGNYFFDPSAFERASLATLNTSGAAVTNPALRTYGTLGRNAFRGPDRTVANLTIGKETNLYGERTKLEIRADFFNLFNHPLWNVLPTSTASTTSITNALFGQITSTGTTIGGINDPMTRVIQLAARLTF